MRLGEEAVSKLWTNAVVDIEYVFEYVDNVSQHVVSIILFAYRPVRKSRGDVPVLWGGGDSHRTDVGWWFFWNSKDLYSSEKSRVRSKRIGDGQVGFNDRCSPVLRHGTRNIKVV